MNGICVRGSGTRERLLRQCIENVLNLRTSSTIVGDKPNVWYDVHKSFYLRFEIPDPRDRGSGLGRVQYGHIVKSIDLINFLLYYYSRAR